MKHGISRSAPPVRGCWRRYSPPLAVRPVPRGRRHQPRRGHRDPLGKAVGIKLFAAGVLVVGLAAAARLPAAPAYGRAASGTAMDGTAIDSTEQVRPGGGRRTETTLTVRRGSSTGAVHFAPVPAQGCLAAGRVDTRHKWHRHADLLRPGHRAIRRWVTHHRCGHRPADAAGLRLHHGDDGQER